jgi:hypothetical protein
LTLHESKCVYESPVFVEKPTVEGAKLRIPDRVPILENRDSHARIALPP